jgi:hypothetical protein
MANNTQLNAPIHPGGQIVRDIEKSGAKTQVVTLDLGGSGPEQLLNGTVPVTTNGAFGDLTQDAWGIPKASLPHSLFHGLWTFDIPASLFFMYENGTQVYTSTNIISENGAGVLRTSVTKLALVMESRSTPRYQPNRGHLYSTALWCPAKANDGIRDWGLATAANGVFFRLKADGLLYAVLRSGVIEVKEELIDTSAVAGFDIEKGNVYDIQYQWRGVGNYNFYINLQLVHVFANLGTLTALSLEDPALPAFYRAVRLTQDVEIKIGCVDITSENGSDDRLQPRVAYANISLSGTGKPVISIHNPLIAAGLINTREIVPTRINFSCDKKAVFKVWRHRDPGLLTGETFAAIGSGSFVQSDSPDTNATAVTATAATVASMELIDVLNVQANGVAVWTNPDRRLTFNLVRGDYLTITATVSVGLVDCVVSWGEAI